MFAAHVKTKCICHRGHFVQQYNAPGQTLQENNPDFVQIISTDQFPCAGKLIKQKIFRLHWAGNWDLRSFFRKMRNFCLTRRKQGVRVIAMDIVKIKHSIKKIAWTKAYFTVSLSGLLFFLTPFPVMINKAFLLKSVSAIDKGSSRGRTSACT